MSPVKKRKKKAVRKVSKKTSKKITKKIAKKKVVKKVTQPGELIGGITHYFGHVSAAVVKLKRSLSLGDTVRVKGHTTDFTQTVSSMQLDHQPISTGEKGQEIGFLANERVRTGDQVYRITGAS